MNNETVKTVYLVKRFFTLDSDDEPTHATVFPRYFSSVDTSDGYHKIVQLRLPTITIVGTDEPDQLPTDPSLVSVSLFPTATIKDECNILNDVVIERDGWIAFGLNRLSEPFIVDAHGSKPVVAYHFKLDYHSPLIDAVIVEWKQKTRYRYDGMPVIKKEFITTNKNER